MRARNSDSDRLKQNTWRNGTAIGLLAVGLALRGYSAFAQAPENPLDQYPGFGLSPEAAIRDETIAYWEAFQRDQAVAACMRRADHSYAADVAFPAAAVLTIAKSMNISPTAEIGSQDSISSRSAALAELDPRVRNRSYVANLGILERDSYYQALLGETANDVEAYDRTGLVPAGQGEEFATGGCTGAAKLNSPSVWDAKRLLADEMDAMRIQVTNSDTINESFKACAQEAGGLSAPHPGFVEESVDSGAINRAQASEILEQCNSVWASEYRGLWVSAAEDLIARYPEVFEGVKRRYSGVVERIRADKSFAAYLKQQIEVAALRKAVKKHAKSAKHSHN